MPSPHDCELPTACRVPGKAAQNPAPMAERFASKPRPTEKVDIPLITNRHAGAESVGLRAAAGQSLQGMFETAPGTVLPVVAFDTP
jgi:hypothetical protein